MTTEEKLQERLDAERIDFTLREQLLRCLAGHPIHHESALDILRVWDAADRFVQEWSA